MPTRHRPHKKASNQMTEKSSENWQPVILAYGFRAFFLCAGLYAVIGMFGWAGWLGIHGTGGQIVESTTLFPALLWHAHEMLFGYTLAVVAGFL